MRTYSTRDEAINREILEPLGEYADSHNIDALADELIISVNNGAEVQFMLKPEIDFWQSVENNALD
ncbi:hypothetical protein NLL33_11435 [Corynebacterium accolens]|uniref:hypothetical protein n=1 Tax=Corynebacterium accolens TaxID=38284 RepID=UPI00266EBC97|nr:hypothetical protein [Corynebacterium accolens]WKS66805.1 hypothetical protein NLL33_11435 [Corynebacterium accolens]